MRYWNEMLSEGGFSYGEAVPPDAALCCEVYVRAINAVAEHTGSNFRAICFDPCDNENPIRIFLVSAEHFGTLSDDQVLGVKWPSGDDEEYPEEKWDQRGDDAWAVAFDLCNALALDGFVVVKPRLDSSFASVLEAIKGGRVVEGNLHLNRPKMVMVR